MSDQTRTKTADDKLDQLISFAIGDEDYGVDIQTVKEVIRHREITRLPKAPAFVKGVINLRGDVIPIMDLRERFNMEQQEYTSMTRVIVVEVDEKLIVLLHITKILTTEEKIELEHIKRSGGPKEAVKEAV